MRHNKRQHCRWLAREKSPIAKLGELGQHADTNFIEDKGSLD
jgi:hypothetical protein